MRRRLDVELRRRALAADIDSARELIAGGRVTVGGAPADNPARLVDSAEAVSVAQPPKRFVSRGGDKLAAALDAFGVDVAGRRALDAGSSTGGFTDCLLQAGAAAVVAVDVGRGQLHNRVATDPRVEVHERTNLRLTSTGDLGEPMGAVVADLSFISLLAVLDALIGHAGPGADLILLVKPQFEATRSEVDAGRGVIADPAIWERALRDVAAGLTTRGAAIMGAMTSPIRGADGNTEFLVHARLPDADGTAPQGARTVPETLIETVVADARTPQR